jgi:hypothetical protein
MNFKLTKVLTLTTAIAAATLLSSSKAHASGGFGYSCTDGNPVVCTFTNLSGQSVGSVDDVTFFNTVTGSLTNPLRATVLSAPASCLPQPPANGAVNTITQSNGGIGQFISWTPVNAAVNLQCIAPFSSVKISFASANGGQGIGFAHAYWDDVVAGASGNLALPDVGIVPGAPAWAIALFSVALIGAAAYALKRGQKAVLTAA